MDFDSVSTPSRKKMADSGRCAKIPDATKCALKLLKTNTSRVCDLCNTDKTLVSENENTWLSCTQCGYDECVMCALHTNLRRKSEKHVHELVAITLTDYCRATINCNLCSGRLIVTTEGIVNAYCPTCCKSGNVSEWYFECAKCFHATVERQIVQLVVKESPSSSTTIALPPPLPVVTQSQETSKPNSDVTPVSTDQSLAKMSAPIIQRNRSSKH